jgi:hypothetical protein
VNEPGLLHLTLAAGRTAAVLVLDGPARRPDALEAALEALGLRASRPVLVLVGGAAGLDRQVHAPLALALAALAPVLAEIGAAVVDGGTSVGVMALMGEARGQAPAPGFPLIGVAPRARVHLPGLDPDPATGATLHPDHSHFLLVPGAEWGDESPWIAHLAGALAGGCPSLTLVAGGGAVTRRDVHEALALQRPILILEGSGGIADAWAADLCGGGPGMVEVVNLRTAPESLPTLIRRRFGAC